MTKQLLVILTVLTLVGSLAWRALSCVTAHDELSYERLAAKKDILRVLVARLETEMDDVAKTTGFHITTWCEGMKHTPKFILSDINDGRIERAKDNLRITFTRLEAVRRALNNPAYLATPPHRRFEKLMELSREDGLVSKEDIDTMLLAYDCALERIRATHRPEDFKTEKLYVIQHEEKRREAHVKYTTASAP